MQDNGRQLHQQAELAREKGDFVTSLQLIAQAIIAYQEEKQPEKISEVLSSQALVYRHLYDSTDMKDYLVLAKHSAMAAFEIAQTCGSNDSLSIAQYNLGKILESLSQISDAIFNFQEAIKLGASDRPALVAEMKTRLATAEYKNGDESAIERFEKSLEELKNAEEKDNYSKNVWLSGAYVHMAEVLISKHDSKARALLTEAEKVINSDLRLKLREKQLKKLKTKLD